MTDGNAEVIETTATPINEENVVPFDEEARKIQKTKEVSLKALAEIWEIFRATPNLPCQWARIENLVNAVEGGIRA